jgi:hypothetical protein
MPAKEIQINGGDKMPIFEFKFKTLVADPSIVLIAPRGSGKSWLVRAILYEFRKIPCGLIISGTERMSPFYSKFFPDSYIFYDYRTEVIQRLIVRQQEILDKVQERQKIGKKIIDPRSFIIMDDCLGQKGAWGKDKPILELLFNGRHYRISYVLTMQFPLGITPELRSNFDYIFLLAENKVSNQKRMWDHYAGMFPTFDGFRNVFSDLTSDYGSLVISNRGAGKGFIETVFWYKAPDLSDINIEMGCKQFNKYHKDNYNSEWKKKARGMDYMEYFVDKKRNKGIIHVDKKEIDDKGNVIDKKNKNI